MTNNNERSFRILLTFFVSLLVYQQVPREDSGIHRMCCLERNINMLLPGRRSVMRKSKRRMRRAILTMLCEHLEQEYGIQCSSETFLGGRLPTHQLDAVLAFKSNPYIDELRNALDRLDEGTYAVCISCKQLISQELLDGDPARRVCGTCEAVYFHLGDEQFPGGVYQTTAPSLQKPGDSPATDRVHSSEE